MKKEIILSLGLPLLCLNAFGWGQKGHDTVAFIAERHLTETSKAALDSILNGKSIVYWANWLDNASHTPEYAYTKTWHYKNIDAGQEYDKAPLHKDGDVVRAIYDQVAILGCDTTSLEQKQLATKILVHIVGDLHQPMHLGHLSDLGGNKVGVKYFKSNRNLHGIWDSALVESAHKWSYTEWAEQLDRLTKDQEMQIIAGGTPDMWAQESYGIATEIYNVTPEGYNVSYDYIADWTPTIESRLLYGGLRLADLLNTAFDPDYVKVNGL
ncbi:MAG: S1/P1 nuclease [Muribaculaceae bacterium]|nr:S1/P1 nuclease [Muribaculaceae bacterium]